VSEKILTITVPSYNTAAFIDKNIPTFLDNRILDKLEVLIINDGSKDTTPQVAQKYVDRYPDTVRLVNKENGGHGSVINKGIEEAKGKYFKVIDGDDWVEKDSLYKLIQELEKTNSDLVINPFHFVFENTGKRRLQNFPSDTYGKEFQFKDVCHLYQKLPIHSITFKTSLLKENSIHVREHCFYEDNEYDLLPIPYVKTITVYDFPVYEYLVAQKNQSISDNNSYKNHLMFYAVVKDCIKCFYENSDVALSIKNYIKRTILELIRSQYNIYLRIGNKKDCYARFAEFNGDLKKNYGDFYTAVGKRYGYIKFIQSENKLSFNLTSQLMKAYKRFTM